MSTRRTRQELIEQGVLKEVPDNGKRASVIHLYLTGRRVTSTQWEEYCPPP